MRVLSVAAAFLLLAPPVAAEWGPYGADGWPVAVDGSSTNPFPGVHANDLAGALNANPPLNAVGDVTVYPYWPILKLELERLAADHPGLVKLHSAGTSTLGLDLFVLEIANFADIEKGTGIPLEEREVAWIDGGHHSNEYSAVYFTSHLAQFLLDDYATNATAKWIVDNRHVWIMPMVNPDGSHAFGRLNANLVNINRNYPVIWGAISDDPVMNNPGSAPASEAETQLMLEWMNKTQPDYYASIHCCGNLWLYPYGIEGMDPVDKALFERVCDESFPTVRESCGPIWSTIYPAPGSSVDSVYEYTGGVAFGFEMSGRGAVSLWGQPITAETVEVQEVESWNGVLYALENLHHFGANLVVQEAEMRDGDLWITVRNDGLGNLTRLVRLLDDRWPPAMEVPAKWNIPTLGPGATHELQLAYDVDGMFEDAAEHTLHLAYGKRNVRSTDVREADFVLVGPSGIATAPPGAIVVQLASSDDNTEAPAAGVLLAFAVLALVAARRR